jgi:hypothetical protein
MTSEETLELLVSQGKITQADLQELNLSINNISFRTLVEGVHAIMCDKDHDMAECKFHEETILEETWKRTCHQIWVEYVRELVTKSNTSPDRLIDDLRRISQVVNAIQSMTIGGKEMLYAILETSVAQPVDQTLSIPQQSQHEETS